MAVKLKLVRRFNAVKNADGKVDLHKRAEALPVVPLQSVGPCPVCSRDLLVAVGQQIRFHKECRKEGRRRFGRATHAVSVEPNENIELE